VSEAVPAGASFTLPLGDFDALSTLILLASSSRLGKLILARTYVLPTLPAVSDHGRLVEDGVSISADESRFT
jgi:hypothetical protein